MALKREHNKLDHDQPLMVPAEQGAGCPCRSIDVMLRWLLDSDVCNFTDQDEASMWSHWINSEMWYLNRDCWQEGSAVSVLVTDWKLSNNPIWSQDKTDYLKILQDVCTTKKKKNLSKKSAEVRHHGVKKVNTRNVVCGIVIYTIDIRSILRGSHQQALCSML